MLALQRIVLGIGVPRVGSLDIAIACPFALLSVFSFSSPARAFWFVSVTGVSQTIGAWLRWGL